MRQGDRQKNSKVESFQELEDNIQLSRGGSRYYRDLPPVARTYGVLCLMTSGAYHLGLINIWSIALSYEDVLKCFQIWRLITNLFFLGPFSLTFAFRLWLM
ncbi:derlin-1-like [Actinidia eriantha]|uniref:derlin-1-like n=1 Tax=Actinidia eriantha TaxID=165200 RepID=UPI0025843B60|nr:derlin-1-like [Actinidia eriantha]